MSQCRPDSFRPPSFLKLELAAMVFVSLAVAPRLMLYELHREGT